MKQKRRKLLLEWKKTFEYDEFHRAAYKITMRDKSI